MSKKYVVKGTAYVGDTELYYLPNTKRPHGKAYWRFEQYKYCQTIAEYFEMMEDLVDDEGEPVKKYARADLNYDFEKGLVWIDGAPFEGEE